MATVRAFDSDDYLPDYSLLVLQDPSVGWPDEEPVIPHHRDRGDSPNGTFAGSGAGWITAEAPDLAAHVIRLELHDTEPAGAGGEFDDVLETPYRSSSGGISLAWVTDGPGDQVDLVLGDAEWFRVRIARRGDESANRFHWLLRFWPEPLITPPVWVARGRDTRNRPASLAQDVESIVRWTPRPPFETTMTELGQRLLVGEAELRAGLEFAQEEGLVHAESAADAGGSSDSARDGGNGSDAGGGPLRLWLGDRAG
ncbi:hypothetical protein [Actinoplanes sp. DH11]|uniref:hypothetical protein n=1 Tax=Actinoplanes sp. DH11 TaxID=2857011 RepID=UPI001E594ED7|nr:hypothetical protein [Actinoplanes sp. DH11]